MFAFTALVRRSVVGISVSGRIGQTLGVVAAASWFVVAGLAVAPYTSVGAGLHELAPTAAAQAPLYALFYLVMTAFLMMFGMAMIGWLIMVATTGRRHGVVGWPVSIAAVLAVGGVLLTFAMPFSAPWGPIAVLAFTLFAGVGLLMRSHTAG